MSMEIEASATTATMADEMIQGPSTALPRVSKPGRVPIKSWVLDLEGSALAQATNLSNLPFAIRHVALMPDAHAGYGMPIGGVLFADRAVVPYAIGVDIGCGVALAETDLTVETLGKDELKATLGQIARDVPVGTAGQPKAVDPERALADIGIDLPASIDRGWFGRAVSQLGTLGSGNHFLELQRDEAGQVRHAALRLPEPGQDDLRRVPQARARGEPPVARDGFLGYWAAMTFALRFAEVNRSRMMDAVEYAFGRHTKVGRFDRLVDVHHNYAAWENHFGSNGIVHRKGAVRARAGETVLIPGSMGTASYVAQGLGNPEAFATSPHGSGRALSRTAARKGKTSKEVFDEMASLGVALYSGDPKTVAEEAAYAYKDIEAVMAASATLVRPTKRLTPLGVVKG